MPRASRPAPSRSTCSSGTRAFSREVAAGSREENASKQESDLGPRSDGVGPWLSAPGRRDHAARCPLRRAIVAVHFR
ncbi:hypothetical protein XH92_33470 [Bradyrhizobium sp. CCBAU 53421]|nr:hypothetical protein XH92_33470 [Bradyrhizobium sp. CCBAU 53421]